jgi:small subunit ribosomal protein S20
MANHPSADKRNRQRITRTARNQAVRSATRTAVKQARAALAGEDAAEAAQKVQAASIALAKAAKKGVIHPVAAARTISRITSALSKRG